MDLSKLPRLSKTDPVPGGPPAGGDGARRGTFCDQCGAELRPGARFCDACGTPTRSAGRPATPDYAAADELGGPGLEVWISVALGILLIVLAPRIWKYFLFKSAFEAEHWTFSDATGAPTTYAKTIFFWGDLALAGFAVSLILEGAALMFARRPLVVLIAFVITVLATIANAYYVVASYKSQGLALLSAIAVIFGVVIAGFEWQLLRMLYHRPKH